MEVPTLDSSGKLCIINSLKAPLNVPSYRNQSIDLLCKSIEWFLYDGNFDV